MCYEPSDSGNLDDKEAMLICKAKQRLDIFLRSHLDVPRSRIEHMIKSKCVLVNSQHAHKAGMIIRPGASVMVLKPKLHIIQQPPLDKQCELDIVYEDACLLIINKQANLTVHPGAGSGYTLVDALRAHLGDQLSFKDTLRPGIVHRLDKHTSGLLIIAKTDTAHAALAQQMAARSIQRLYLAWICKGLIPAHSTISAPIGRHTVHRKKMCVTPSGRHAVTHYRTLSTNEHTSLILCKLETGRTHQIRVHMAHKGCPILGDATYGSDAQKLCRNALHAFHISFQHPLSGTIVQLTTGLPRDLRHLVPVPLENLRYYVRLVCS